MIKIDPYLNVDAGTMSPFEHGETFVLDDGGETDLDLGNYERFLDISLCGSDLARILEPSRAFPRLIRGTMTGVRTTTSRRARSTSR